MSKKDDTKIANIKRYELLINARNFHYENFNKWVTYFYLATSALFLGYFTLAKVKEEFEMEKILILFLGFFVSLYWYWSSKGYYFWNINFITLINHHEEKVLKLKDEERVYFVFANKKTQNKYSNPTKGANVSTSKVAILFAFTVSISWSTLLFEKLFDLFKYDCDSLQIPLSLMASIVSVILISNIVPRLWLKSKIDHFPDLEIEQKTR